MRLACLAALALLGFAGAAQAQVRDLADLRAALHLTAAQEDAWRAFAAANAPDPADDARHRNAAMLAPTLTSPRRVDLATAVMQTDLDEMKRRGKAIKAFYATLGPEQRAVFDRETAPRQR
jgi:protein CpxP